MIRVLFISAVKPRPSSAGSALLHRHLADNPDIELHVLETEPNHGIVRKIARKLLGRLGRTCLHRFCQDILAIWRGGWIDPELGVHDGKGLKTLVVTVAHGEACYAAQRYAKRQGLPLVTFFHDWWPDIADVHAPFGSIVDRSFRKLYRDSSLALCVSRGMQEALGPHKNAQVLLPIPAYYKPHGDRRAYDSNSQLKLLYAGNLDEYGEMLMNALDVLKDHPDIRLEVRGNSSRWPKAIREEMSERGLLLPFVPRDELTGWLESADAFLITQSFDQEDERLMSTNFPSKLPELSQFCMPLILWGPSYATGPQWARATGHGMVVDEADPTCLKHALETLIDDSSKYQTLVDAARIAAVDSFAPEKIQSDFMDYIYEVAG